MSFTAGDTPFGYFDSDAEFVADADKIVNYVNLKIGSPVMAVHLSSSQIYASFEEATLEFSAVVNSYQAKSVLTQFLGAPTGSLSGSEQTYPNRILEMQKQLSEPYAGEANVGGRLTVHKDSIDLVVGQQEYDLNALLSGSGGLTGSNGNKRPTVRKLYHYSPLSAYRFFGTTSAVNYLHNQFSFESFTPETIFYLLPIWEDILRGMQFETSNRIRRSNYGYNIRNNVLSLYPTPTQAMKLWIEYVIEPDSTSASGQGDKFYGVSNLSNVPFGNIEYSKVNSIGKNWIRRFTFALAKEIEGQIRSKMNTVPIPNGDLTLNGPELINDARADQDELRNELKEMLEDLTYDKLAAREAEMIENVQRTWEKVPLGIYVGVFVGVVFVPLFLI